MMYETTKSELRKGYLIFAVLQALKNKKMYTAEILKRLSTTEFNTQEGTLYPLLSKLKREGLISHEWVESRSGPPRKYYCTTEKGNAYAKELQNYTQKIHHQLNALVIDKEE